MQTKPSCYFLTWNLSANTHAEHAAKAFELVVEHLAKQGTFIAALQEVPQGSASLAVTSGRVRVVERTAHAKVMLLHSNDLRPLRPEIFERMSGAALVGDVWGIFRF